MTFVFLIASLLLIPKYAGNLHSADNACDYLQSLEQVTYAKKMIGTDHVEAIWPDGILYQREAEWKQFTDKDSRNRRCAVYTLEIPKVNLPLIKPGYGVWIELYPKIEYEKRGGGKVAEDWFHKERPGMPNIGISGDGVYRGSADSAVQIRDSINHNGGRITLELVVYPDGNCIVMCQQDGFKVEDNMKFPTYTQFNPKKYGVRYTAWTPM